MPNSNEDSFGTTCARKTEYFDNNWGPDTTLRGNDKVNESDPAEVTTKKAMVERKVEETSERLGARTKGRNNVYKDIRLTPTPSKSINAPIHFCNDTFSTSAIIPRCS
ncbi:hypothetical protein ACOME3_000471 [Neoechinorhynchus agilis]